MSNVFICLYYNNGRVYSGIQIDGGKAARQLAKENGYTLHLWEMGDKEHLSELPDETQEEIRAELKEIRKLDRDRRRSITDSIRMLHKKAEAEYNLWLANEAEYYTSWASVCYDEIHRAIMYGKWDKYASFLIQQEERPIKYIYDMLNPGFCSNFIYNKIVECINSRFEKMEVEGRMSL